MTPNGYILHETPRLVIIATGFRRKSANVKTGAMVQVWILRADMHPLEAVANGRDRLICGDCPHRGDRKNGRKRSCYVNVGQAPSAVYRAYLSGAYPKLPLESYAEVFTGRAVRLGAYGDPARIPEPILARIVAFSRKHTGYTHQWRSSPWLKPYVMASCDSKRDYRDATRKGWRTFRVTAGELASIAGEILCPASEAAGHKTQCARCGLCNGSGPTKNIFIPVHGAGASNFVILN